MLWVEVREALARVSNQTLANFASVGAGFESQRAHHHFEPRIAGSSLLELAISPD
jgi:hypothetical protein